MQSDMSTIASKAKRVWLFDFIVARHSNCCPRLVYHTG